MFGPNENTITNILAYLLNPKSKHGQKDRLLRVFLQCVGAKEAVALLDQGKPIAVLPQSNTDNGRPIDAVLIFGNYDYVIGIENKAKGAVDQKNQINDYIEDLKDKVQKSGGGFLMLYLPPYHSDPSPDSIVPEILAEYRKRAQFKIVPFCGKDDECSVISILNALSDAARADSVRCFTKFLVKYFEVEFRGGTTMDEQKFVLNYVRQHPEVMEHRCTLNDAFETLKDEFMVAVFNQLKDELKIDDVRSGKSAIYRLLDKPVWKKEPVPICIQVDFSTCDGVLRVGVQSDKKSMKELFDDYVKKPINDVPYKWVSGCWEGGYFEHFISSADLINYFKHQKLPSFENALDQLYRYCERIKELCRQYESQ